MNRRRSKAFFGCALAAKLIATFAAASVAAAANVEVGADQFAKLGIVTGRPQAAAEMTIATAPAEVVVPPMQQALLSAAVPGRLARLYVAEGDTVSAGDRLAEIESPEFLQWQRDYLAALADSELAQAQLKRDQAMLADGIVAERRVAETSARARSAALTFAQARQQLEMAGMDATAMQRLAAGADMSSRLTLLAPFQGSILEAYTDIGERLDWLDPVVRLADLNRLWLEVRVPQEVAARVHAGMTVAANTAGNEIVGEVLTVGRAVDSATQSVLVRASVDNDDDLLRAGQFLSVRIFAPIEDSSIYAVPIAAVTRVGDASYVFVRNSSGFSAEEVAIAATDPNSAFISGIGRDAEIAFSGIGALKSLWMSTEEGE
jgi:cobalt-zinc-cadmium efflux system membrane fusion protein